MYVSSHFANYIYPLNYIIMYAWKQNGNMPQNNVNLLHDNVSLIWSHSWCLHVFTGCCRFNAMSKKSMAICHMQAATICVRTAWLIDQQALSAPDQNASISYICCYAFGAISVNRPNPWPGFYYTPIYIYKYTTENHKNSRWGELPILHRYILMYVQDCELVAACWSTTQFICSLCTMYTSVATIQENLYHNTYRFVSRYILYHDILINMAHWLDFPIVKHER